MTFTKRLREGVRRGEITCTVRIWTRPHVRVGARYRMEEGEIEADSIQPIGFPDITHELARESGFLGVLDLLKVAKHGRGENIYLIRSTTCDRVPSEQVSISQRPMSGNRDFIRIVRRPPSRRPSENLGKTLGQEDQAVQERVVRKSVIIHRG